MSGYKPAIVLFGGSVCRDHGLAGSKLAGDVVGVGGDGDKIVSSRWVKFAARGCITAAGTGGSAGHAAGGGKGD